MAQQVEALAAYAWGPEFDFQNPQKTGKEKKRTNSPELPSDPHLHTVRCMHPPHDCASHLKVCSCPPVKRMAIWVLSVSPSVNTLDSFCFQVISRVIPEIKYFDKFFNPLAKHQVSFHKDLNFLKVPYHLMMLVALWVRRAPVSLFSSCRFLSKFDIFESSRCPGPFTAVLLFSAVCLILLFFREILLKVQVPFK